MKDITIYPSRKRQLIFILINLFFLYLSFTTCRMYWFGSKLVGKIIAIILGLLTLVFIYNTIFRIRDFLKNNFLFKLTSDGFYDRTAPLELEADFISWDMIEDIQIEYFNIEGFITVYLKDNEDFIKKASWYRKLIIKQNLEKGFGALNISKIISKDILLIDLAKELNKRLENHRKNQDGRV